MIASTLVCAHALRTRTLIYLLMYTPAHIYSKMKQKVCGLIAELFNLLSSLVRMCIDLVKKNRVPYKKVAENIAYNTYSRFGDDLPTVIDKVPHMHTRMHTLTYCEQAHAHTNTCTHAKMTTNARTLTCTDAHPHVHTCK